jgi:hypothetical protein
LLIAFSMLAVAAVVAPGAVPMYDGIGNPDEPYRYVQPPAGYRVTKPPTTATAELSVRNGHSAAAQINTAEFGPQLALLVPAGAFASSSSSRLTVTAAPIAAPDPPPSDGRIVGNVYRVTATATAGTVDLIGLGNQAPVLDMRAPTARQPGPVFEHLGHGRWTAYKTSRVGNDVYRVRMDALGDWALVRRAASGTSSGSRGKILAVAAAVLGGCGLGLGVLAVRRSRKGSSAGRVSG